MNIAVFFHIAKMNNYREVSSEMMDVLKSSLLLSKAKIFTINECKDISLFEFPTLEMMHEFSRNCQNYHCLYLHTKGVSKPTNHQMADWRRCMMYFLVENWMKCTDKLDNGFDTVSINYIKSPAPHFQGNFFWAKSSYISTLKTPRSLVLPKFNEWSERHKCEQWILSNPKAKACSLYHHRINPYIENNPRSNYINTKF